MPHSLDETSRPVRFSLTGDCVVDDARQLHAALVRALAEHEHLVLDVSAVDYADITLVQLLLGALQAAQASGKRLELTGPASAAMLNALHVAGVECEPLVDDFLTQAQQATCGLRED